MSQLIEYLDEELESLKAAAAAATTYGDDDRVREDLVEQIAWLRQAERKYFQRIRRYVRRFERERRARARIGEQPDTFWMDLAKRDQAVLAKLRWHRRERVLGLAEQKRVRKQHLADLNRILDELRAEREREGR